MVLKKSKYSGNTGNTLRATRRQGKGITQLLQNALFVLVDGNNGHTHFDIKSENNPNHKRPSAVLYSLNKRNGWNFQKELTEKIEAIANDKKEPNSGEKQVFKKHGKNIKKNGDTILIAEVINKPPHFENRIKLYMDTTGEKKISRSCKPNVQIKKQRGIDDVTYRIQSCVQTTTWPYHNIYKQDRSIKPRNKEKTKFKRYELKHRNFFKDENDDDYLSVNDEIVLNKDMDNNTKQCRFKLEDFIRIKEKRKKKRKNKGKGNANSIQAIKNQNLKLVTIPFHDDFPAESETTTPPLVAENVLEDVACSKYSFLCTLCSYSISYDNLQNKYGSLYLEGKSFPRKFLIFKEISSSCPVVLLTTKSNEEQITSVIITIMGTVERINFEQFINRTSNFEEIINQIFPSFNNVNNHQRVSIIHYPSMKHVNMNMNNFKNYQDSATLLILNDIRLQLNKSHSNKDASVYICHNFVEDTVCGICFEDLTSDIITLQACGHSFCRSCWSRYMKTKLSSGLTAHVLCPQLNCESQLDPVTLVSLADSYNDYVVYYRKLIDNFVMNEPTMKYCPTLNCVSVARVEKNTYNACRNTNLLQSELPIVSCTECTQKWCFHCQNVAHWPISCSAAEEYRSSIENVLDTFGNPYNTTVNGKICPYCHNFIEKDGGCNMMHCLCSPLARFCWNCLQPLGSVTLRDAYVHECSTKRDEEELVSTAIEFLNGRKKSLLVQKAVKLHARSLKVGKRKPKLRLTKFLKKFNHNVGPGYSADSLTMFINEAYCFLCDCYRFLEMLYAGMSTVVFQYNSSTMYILREHSDKMIFMVGLLDDSLDVSHIGKIDVAHTKELIENINEFVHGIYKLKC